MKATRLFPLFVLSLLAPAVHAQGILKSRELKLEDIWLGSMFSQRSVNGVRSMQDGQSFTTLEKYKYGQCIVKQAYKTGQAKDTLFKGEMLGSDPKAPGGIENYNLSQDEKKILIVTGSEQIYRHSSKAYNYVYDLKSKKLRPLSEKGKQMYATFSPDGSKVAFVRDNNLFISDLATGTETAVTTDGERNRIINGANDWVYEEEFSFDVCFYWNDNGSRLAYYRFDESNVKEYDMTEYNSLLYPTYYKYKYPKAGEDNSVVTLHVYELATGKTTKVDVGPNPDQYIPRVKWTRDNNTLSFQRLNRLQNKLELLLADASTGVSRTIITEQSDTYVEVVDYLQFLSDNKTFIWSSEKDGYNHLYLYDLTGKEIRQITKGNWDVMKFYGINEKTKTLYFQSPEASATQRDVYSIGLDGTGKTKLSTRKGTNDANFSSTFEYYINYQSDANTPLYVTLNNNKGKELRVLEDNALLKKTLTGFDLGKKEFLQIPTPDSLLLNAWMIKPPGFNDKKPYPILMIVYGGPGHNTVNDAWEGRDYMWHQLMAQKGYIVVSVDNRGTMARGAKFKKCTYKQLGKLEILDQTYAVNYFAHQPYGIKNRIGIWGWSFGGYMSSLAITKYSSFFKTAVAIAPVTNWRYYDNIYTERFLQKPQDNPEGYDDNSPINFTKDLIGKYLLIHGTADDNVHFQNTVEMVNSLEKNNRLFDMMIFPDRNHSINGGNTRLNLYNKVTDYLVKNL